MAKQTLQTAALVIKAPNFQRAVFHIVGTAPYVQAKFSSKALAAIREKMVAGSQSRKGQKRAPRDFQADYENAQHRSKEGWVGIPCSGLRQACISACRIVGFKMTLAKLSVFIEPHGFDETDGTPLLKIKGKPRPHEMPVRNATGVMDIRCRPMWDDWSADVPVRWDADQFSTEDITNLLSRVGQQVGIGEGRPDSKSSSGLGWGLFDVKLADV